MTKLIAIILLLMGVAAYYGLTDGFNPSLITLGPLGPAWLAVFALIVLAIGWMAPIAGPIDRLLQRCSRSSPPVQLLSAIAVAWGSSVYLYLTAVTTHRQLFPYIHDEFSYLIQAHQFAKHKLWMPEHPIGQFFESFQIFTQRVYASAYFPGTAIVHLPGVLLHWPPFVTSIIISGIVAGLLYWLATELIDGVAGWLAVLLLLSDRLFRQESTLILSHMPVLMWGLLATIAWLRWRKNRASDWAIAIGFFVGFAAITRPVDALGFAIPILCAVLAGCVRNNPDAGSVFGPEGQTRREVLPSAGSRATARFAFTTFSFIFTGMLPFISLQLLLNHGITGSWATTPFQRYADREYPGSNYGFADFNSANQAQSNLPQVHAMYDSYRPLLKQHQLRKVPDEIAQRARYVASQISATPFPLLIVLWPMSLLSIRLLRPGQRWPAIGVLIFLPLFLLLYAPYFLFLPTYALPAAPAVIFGILLGLKSTVSTFPAARRFITVALTLFVAGLSLTALPDGLVQPPEDVFSANLLADVNRQLAKLPQQPAVVLFTYDPARNVNEEPVYNADVAWPDDADVIRAHDLGPMNGPILQYYSERQPARVFYRYDEKTRKLRPLVR